MAEDMVQPLKNIVRDPNLLASKRAELDQLRSKHTRDWALNRAFYNDNQWAFWNRVTSRVESLPTDDGDKPRYKVRLVDNQIKPGVQHYVAQLTKTKPVIRATPDSSSYRDVLASQMAESLYQYWWEQFNLTSKLQSALVQAQLSQGYWKITWDPLAGKLLKVMVDPNSGQPIVDGELADAYREEIEKEAQQAGMDPQEALQHFEMAQYVGEIDVEVMAGENVYLDPAAANFEDAMFAICKHAMDPDEIAARWGKKVQPDSSPTDAPVPLAFTADGRDDKKPRTTKDVYIGYFRPGPSLPKGRYVVWIEEPNMILAQSDWPYPFDILPLVKMPGIEKPDDVYDAANVTSVRPLQKEYNRTRSQIIEHKNITIKPQMVAPYGSLRNKLTGEPGAVFEYNPIQGLQPEWRPQPPLPQYVFAHLADIRAEIDKKFNRLPSQRDQLPARTDAGYTVELIQEAVADQLTPVVRRMEAALARAGTIMAALAQHYYIEPRLLKIKGPNGAVQAKKFMNSDLAGGFGFRAETDTGLPRTRSGRQQRIIELVNAKIMDPTVALKYLDLGDVNGAQAEAQADEDLANRKIAKLVRGEPVNPQAVAEAMAQAQMAMQDPTADVNGDGMPDPPEMKAQILQQQIQDAALTPLPFENKAVTLQVLKRFMTSLEFEQLPPEIQQNMTRHFELVAKALNDETPPDPKMLPQVSVGTKATVSAPVMTEILRKHGIDVSEEQVAEAPLETAVYDSTDKIDASETGNNPLEDWEKVAAIQQAEQKHTQATAKAAHDLSAAQVNQSVAESNSVHDARRAEEIHQARLAQEQQKLGHADQMHQERLRQARKPKPKASAKK